MSSTAITIPPYVFEQQGTFTAPFTYTIPATLEIRPDTATATFDGTGAAGDFLACLTFYSPEGSRLCRMFNPNAVTAGDVAEVTFVPPFGAAATNPTPVSGPGTWYYATPVAPATAPVGALPGAAFQGTWANVALLDGSYSPLRYRLEPTTGDVEVEGAIGGGLFGTTALQMPAGYVPTYDIYKIVAGTDGSAGLVAIVNTSGLLIPQGRASFGTAKVAVTSGNLSSATTTFHDATGVGVNLTTLGGTRVLIVFSGGGRTSGAGSDVSVDVTIDGTRQGQSLGLATTSDTVPVTTGYNLNLSFSYVSDVLTAGVHTFQIQWKVSAGTGTFFAATTFVPAVLSVIELAA